jgi:putative ABC transport system permease protein
MSLARGNLRMALASVRSTKWRSLLTMLGIVIGIVSVVASVGIGEGVKRSVLQQINQFGTDLVTVRPGKPVPSQGYKSLLQTDLLFGSQTLSGLNDTDVQNVQQSEHVAVSVPLGIVSGVAEVDGQTSADNTVIATTSRLPAILGKSVAFGDFFQDDGTYANTAVIGSDIANNLFGEPAPLGRKFTFRGQTFAVRGVFAQMPNTPLTPTTQFNNAIFIPVKTAQGLTQNTTQYYSILARPDSPQNEQDMIAAITNKLQDAHGGAQDFSVLNADQTAQSGNGIIHLLTVMTIAVAAIALVLGGVGIMNIMLVSVTERMHEIGVRKAIGATNRQILGQFMLEALSLGVAGGVVGVVVSLATCYGLRVYTDLKPVVSWQAIVIATTASILISVISGVAPAVKAARKDPINALRHE